MHFAEQRAAPYSQKNAKTKRYTIDNNLGATHNVLCGIVESGACHFLSCPSLLPAAASEPHAASHLARTSPAR